jgi:hypothetical protein
VAAVACVLGASFGLLSEYLAGAMTKTSESSAASPATTSAEGSPA